MRHRALRIMGGSDKAAELRRRRSRAPRRTCWRSRSCLTAQTTSATHTTTRTAATATTTCPLSPKASRIVLVFVSTISPPAATPSTRAGEVPDQPGRERCGDHAADQQRDGVPEVDALAAEREQEAERAADGDDELRGVDRADDLARLQPTGGEQRRGADRTPATAADGVHQAGDQAERGQEARRRGWPLNAGRRPPRTRKRQMT